MANSEMRKVETQQLQKEKTLKSKLRLRKKKTPTKHERESGDGSFWFFKETFMTFLQVEEKSWNRRDSNPHPHALAFITMYTMTRRCINRYLIGSQIRFVLNSR